MYLLIGNKDEIKGILLEIINIQFPSKKISIPIQKLELVPDKIQEANDNNEEEIDFSDIDNETIDAFCMNCGQKFKREDDIAIISVTDLNGEQYKENYHIDCIPKTWSTLVYKSIDDKKIIKAKDFNETLQNGYKYERSKAEEFIERKKIILGLIKEKGVISGDELFRIQNVYKDKKLLTARLHAWARDGLLERVSPGVFKIKEK